MNAPCRLIGASCLLALAPIPATCAAPASIPQQQTVITSDGPFTSQSTDTETTVVLTDHCVVTGTDLVLTCDKLTAVMSRTGDKEAAIGQPGAFKDIVATGHVHIVQGDREATCGRAEIIQSENKTMLSEHVVFTDHSNNVVATSDEPVFIYRNDRIVHGEHVRFVAGPLKDLGVEKSQPSQTPAPAEAAPKP